LNKKKLSIFFTDFWPNFRLDDNYFFHLLSKKYDLEIDSKNPDVLFYSADYANVENHRKFNNDHTKKIFFSGETFNNVNNDSFSLTCKKNSQNNLRLPLWVIFIDWFDVKYDLERDPSFLIPKSSLIKTKRITSNFSPLFCSFIASKPSGLRVDFVPNLNKYKKTHNLGRLYNNSFYRIKGRGDQKYKLNAMKLFKFNIAFENTIAEGYVTEKLIHSFYSKTIPIYWGSSEAKKDFNPNSFIFFNDYESEDHLIEEILKINNNNKKRMEILNEEIFINNKFPEFSLPENVLTKISEVIENG